MTNDTQVQRLLNLAARHVKHKVEWCNGWPDIWSVEMGIYEQWRPNACDDQSEELRKKLKIEIFITPEEVMGRRAVGGRVVGVMRQQIDRNSDVKAITRWIILNLAALQG